MSLGRWIGSGAGVLFLSLLVVAGCTQGSGQLPLPPDAQLLEDPSFRRNIQPILAEYCVKCHNNADDHGELVLETYDSIMRSPRKVPVVVPGSPEKSLLVEVIAHESITKMPFHGEKLTPNRIANIETWVRLGARDD
ncbi:MAG: hypothetical protein HY687_04350 [Chloroflexi bacterium]|nr:hypothetical protein [Chloroflexota bacterium]